MDEGRGTKLEICQEKILAAAHDWSELEDGDGGKTLRDIFDRAERRQITAAEGVGQPSGQEGNRAS